MFVLWQDLGHPCPVGDLEQGVEPVGAGLIRTHHPEVAAGEIELHHVAQKLSHFTCRLSANRSWGRHPNRIVWEIRQLKILQQLAAIRVWVGSHTAFSLRSKFRQLRDESPIRIEKFFWLVALHPVFEYFQVLRV